MLKRKPSLLRKDKRRVTSREEMQRLFQAAGLFYADSVPVPETSPADIVRWVFQDYYQNRYHERLVQESGNFQTT